MNEFPAGTIKEIIETYWNVNSSCTSVNLLEAIEIIETYWNVNEQAVGAHAVGNNEIIETYWNVNLIIQVINSCCHD